MHQVGVCGLGRLDADVLVRSLDLGQALPVSVYSEQLASESGPEKILTGTSIAVTRDPLHAGLGKFQEFQPGAHVARAIGRQADTFNDVKRRVRREDMRPSKFKQHGSNTRLVIRIECLQNIWPLGAALL